MQHVKHQEMTYKQLTLFRLPSPKMYDDNLRTPRNEKGADPEDTSYQHLEKQPSNESLAHVAMNTLATDQWMFMILMTG